MGRARLARCKDEVGETKRVGAAHVGDVSLTLQDILQR